MMQSQPMPVDATAILTVKLQAQQWNAVIHGLSRGRYDRVAGLINLIGEQLNQQTQAQQMPEPELPKPNGFDHTEDKAA